jgi:ribosomal-protein-alanine N-acetyltransferase
MLASTDALNRIRTARRLSGGRPAPQRRAPVEVTLPTPLRTDRLLLRPLRASDRSEFLRVVALSRSHLSRFCPLHQPGETDAMLFERHLAMTDAAERLGRAWRRIVVLSDGRLAGAININDLSRGLESAGEINWWVSADCTGRGLGTEAVTIAADFALSDLPGGLGLTALRALVTPDNGTSRRIAARAEFSRRRWEPSVELNLAGRWAAHDAFVRYAEVASELPEETAPPPASRRLLRAGLANILATEATTLLRARRADPARTRANFAPALALA